MKTWWEKASTEDRLAQIDGGIECGMTAKQISMCVGAPLDHRAGSLGSFARSHGRFFISTSTMKRDAGRSGGMVSGLIAARRKGCADYEISSAFEIFGPREASQNLFEEA